MFESCLFLDVFYLKYFRVPFFISETKLFRLRLFKPSKDDQKYARRKVFAFFKSWLPRCAKCQLLDCATKCFLIYTIASWFIYGFFTFNLLHVLISCTLNAICFKLRRARRPPSTSSARYIVRRACHPPSPPSAEHVIRQAHRLPSTSSAKHVVLRFIGQPPTGTARHRTSMASRVRRPVR